MRDFLIGLVVGLMSGGALGVIAMALIVAGRDGTGR